MKRQEVKISTRVSTMTRGQLAGHVLMFILGLAIMGGILLVGYRAIATLHDEQCAAQNADFASSLRSAIDRNRGAGTSRFQTFSLPCGASEVCFVSRSIVDDHSRPRDVLIVGQKGTAGVIQASILSDDGTNVFVLKNNGYEPVSGFSESAPIDLGVNSTTNDIQAITCVSGSEVNLRFTGSGRTVSITRES